jgi:hypothetical protein
MSFGHQRLRVGVSLRLCCRLNRLPASASHFVALFDCGLVGVTFFVLPLVQSMPVAINACVVVILTIVFPVLLAC